MPKRQRAAQAQEQARGAYFRIAAILIGLNGSTSVCWDDLVAAMIEAHDLGCATHDDVALAKSKKCDVLRLRAIQECLMAKSGGAQPQPLRM